MSSVYQNITRDGGKLLITGGHGPGFWPDDLRKSNQVIIWTDDDLRNGAYREIPKEVKAVALSRAISHKTAHMILKQAKEKRLLIIPGFKNSGEISRIARDILSSQPVEMKIASPIDEEMIETHLKDNEVDQGLTQSGEPRKIAAHGAIKQFVIEMVNLKNPTSEEAKRLFDIAQARGLKTTVGSLEQAIRVRRKVLNLGEIPRSATPRSKEPAFRTAMRDVENAIAAFQLLKEHIEELAKENQELKLWKQQVAEKFKVLFGSDLNV